MIDMITGFFASIIYALIVPGLVVGFAAIIFSFFLPVTLLPYKTAFLAGGIALVLFFTYYAGKHVASRDFEAKIAEQEKQVAIWKDKSNQVTTETVIKYVDKIKLVDKVKTEYATVYVDKYITPDIDTKYPLPNEFVYIYNGSIKAVAPNGDVPIGTSQIKLSDATKIIVENNFTCKANTENLISLQDWVNAQWKLSKDKQ